MTARVNVVINGDAREIPAGITVSELLAHLGLRADRVAIERNLQILAKPQWAGTTVEPGDRYEIVQLVGGG